VRGFYIARRQSAATGIVVAALLVVGTTCGCSDVRGPAASSRAPIESNTELAARVKAALRAAPYVNDIHIDVFIENGNVVLRGLVEDEHALLDVLDIAEKAADGHKVIDAITIIKTSPH
jgi:osmotically-inducible protein OsmY